MIPYFFARKHRFIPIVFTTVYVSRFSFLNSEFCCPGLTSQRIPIGRGDFVQIPFRKIHQ